MPSSAFVIVLASPPGVSTDCGALFEPLEGDDEEEATSSPSSSDESMLWEGRVVGGGLQMASSCNC